MAPEREIGVDPLLERVQPLCIEPCNRRRDERLGGDVGEGRTPPQLERLAEQAGSALVVTGGLRLHTQGGEAIEIERSRLDLEDVPRAHGCEASSRHCRAPSATPQRRPAARSGRSRAGFHPRARRSSAPSERPDSRSTAGAPATARCFRGPRSRATPSRRASRGPRTPNCRFAVAVTAARPGRQRS